ncbi:ABC transporter substrate-binding protein [Xanthobacter autotrophicus]|uniref:ABC transporter substrate-binding protein n=1 Tax=Xanthobacter autotrophicus TaxID=280 RepID=UPI0024A6BFC6|nr:extracellular solute-binding protein [Xanthobacter autotrophicus]MDI4658348.1 extracellular solute-binding protein [Xanthobacter autotrophicus]
MLQTFSGIDDFDFDIKKQNPEADMTKTDLTLSGAPSRRAVLGALGAGAAVLAAPRLARAQEGTLVVSNWGGDWNERTIRFVEAPLVESRGIKIVRDLGMEPERKAKLIAEKRLRRGTIDVIHINEGDSVELNTQEVLSDIDFSKVPNYADVVPALKSKPFFVPWLYSGVSIIYNKDKVPNPPKSYEELWDKKWAGRIGLTNQLYFNYIMMAGLIKGGNVTNTDQGKERLIQLKELTQPRIYAAHQQLGAGLVNGEVDIAVNYKARGLQWANDGAPLAIQYPSEGAIAVMFGAALPKRAPSPDLASIYFNAMLDRKAMAGLAGASFYAPANAKAELTDELRAKVDFTAAQAAALKFPDYAHVAKNTAEWLEWWNKNIAR